MLNKWMATYRRGVLKGKINKILMHVQLRLVLNKGMAAYRRGS